MDEKLTWVFKVITNSSRSFSPVGFVERIIDEDIFYENKVCQLNFKRAFQLSKYDLMISINDGYVRILVKSDSEITTTVKL